jgi:hypothetical protein
MGLERPSPPHAQSLVSAVARRANGGRESREKLVHALLPDRIEIAVTTAPLESTREGACRSEERQGVR